MKIVVIGGTGQLGSKIVAKLQEDGHEATAASPDSGVDTITGEGLAEALAGAQVVVDASNAPVWDDAAVLDFFRTSSRNLTAAAAKAGVRHYVAMSIVGADRLPDSGYLRAKVAQEEVVRGAAVPFTIVRATQFFEFIGRIADSSAAGSTVRMPAALFQPAAVAELAAAVAGVAEGEPANGVVEVAGPEPLRMDEAVARVLDADGDARTVVTDAHAQYFGTELNTESLVPDENPRLTPTRFEDWLGQR
jgi:uncharacterized protein YbjT (DUF2867 family)